MADNVGVTDKRVAWLPLRSPRPLPPLAMFESVFERVEHENEAVHNLVKDFLLVVVCRVSFFVLANPYIT